MYEDFMKKMPIIVKEKGVDYGRNKSRRLCKI